MTPELEIKASGHTSNVTWKFRIIAGAISVITFAILAYLYSMPILIMVSCVSGMYVIRQSIGVYHQYKLARYMYRQREAEVSKLEFETEKAQHEATKAKAETFFIQTNSGVFQLAGILVEKFYPAVSASKELAELPLLPAATEQTKYRKLLDIDFIHLLIVGPTDSGKTTCANWLIDNSNAETFVCDPHGKFNVWSSRVSKVVGNGRDYQAIDNTLSFLLGEMHKRYQANETNFTKLLIVIDEWLSVKEHCENAEQFFSTIGSEARKVNMSLIITTISATVDDLNCSAAVRDNLTQLSLNRTLKAQNLGEVKYSRRDTELVELPGRYIQALPPRIESLPVKEEEEVSPISYDAGPLAYSPTINELKVYELFNAGESLRSIYQKVFNTSSFGGNQAGELKAILAKFGVNLA